MVSPGQLRSRDGKLFMIGWVTEFLRTIVRQNNSLIAIGNTELLKLHRIEQGIERQNELLGHLVELLTPPPPVPGEMHLHWASPEGSIAGALNSQTREESNSMSGKETDTQTVACSEVETDGQGNLVTLNPANVVWAIDDATIATLTQNADGSATFKAVKPVAPAVNPRTANVSCTDTVTNVVGKDTLEVDDSPTKPGTMVLTFGTAA
jgi:hypothetical protein